MRPLGALERLARALGEYIDRLCAGEDIDRTENRTTHPDLAEALLEELETLRGIGSAAPEVTALEELGRHRILREIGRTRRDADTSQVPLSAPMRVPPSPPVIQGESAARP